jgi:hypothetical protein
MCDGFTKRQKIGLLPFDIKVLFRIIFRDVKTFIRAAMIPLYMLFIIFRVFKIKEVNQDD